MVATNEQGWKPVPFQGYNKIYEVSTSGIVRRIDNKQIRRTYKHKSGYVRVLLSCNGEHLNISLHRLVALTYIPNPNPELYNQVGHLDDDKTNNCVSNLYWTNAQENNCHGGRLNKQIETTDKKRAEAKAHKRGKKVPVFKLVPTSISGATAVWYCSISEAARQNDLKPVDIKAACSGIRDTAGGFRWCLGYDESGYRRFLT